MALSQGILVVVNDTFTDETGNFQPHDFSASGTFPCKMRQIWRPEIVSAVAKLSFSSDLPFFFPQWLKKDASFYFFEALQCYAYSEWRNCRFLEADFAHAILIITKFSQRAQHNTD